LHCVAQELEKQFEDSPKLLPPGKADAILNFCKKWEGVSRSMVSLTFAQAPPTEEQKPVVDSLVAFLDELEKTVEEHGGPHLFGDFSLADITVASFLPHLKHAKIDAINLQRHPRVAKAMGILEARGSYQATTVDYHTRATIFAMFFGAGQQKVRLLQTHSDAAPRMQGQGRAKCATTALLVALFINAKLARHAVCHIMQADMAQVPEEEMQARKEAAAKIARNCQVVIKRLLSHSGVVRRQGSEFGETLENVNGAVHERSLSVPLAHSVVQGFEHGTSGSCTAWHLAHRVELLATPRHNAAVLQGTKLMQATP
jgi:hypothetical protein